MPKPPPAPLYVLDLPTARAVALAFRRAYRRHAYKGVPYSAASEAAEIAYRALHPEASDVEALTATSAIIASVEAEHPGWLFEGAPPRPRDARHVHDAFHRNRDKD
jgi:hypothetical protein